MTETGKELEHTRWHVGALNDAVFITTGHPPSASNDHPTHDFNRDVVAKMPDASQASIDAAKSIASAHNALLSAYAGMKEENARLREALIEGWAASEVAADLLHLYDETAAYTQCQTFNKHAEAALSQKAEGDAS